MALLSSVFCLALLLVTTSSPVTRPVSLITAARVAKFDDVAHTFVSAYKSSISCPSTVRIKSMSVIHATNIGEVLFKDIQVDGAPCYGEGADKMSIVSEATVKSVDLLTKLGFPKTNAALQKKSSAYSIIYNKKKDTSFLLGFDEGKSVCGKYSQSEDAFWFFINEPSKFRFIMRHPANGALNLTLPSNSRGLFIVDGSDKLCLLHDTKTSGDRKVSITGSNPDAIQSILEKNGHKRNNDNTDHDTDNNTEANTYTDNDSDGSTDNDSDNHTDQDSNTDNHSETDGSTDDDSAPSRKATRSKKIKKHKPVYSGHGVAEQSISKKKGYNGNNDNTDDDTDNNTDGNTYTDNDSDGSTDNDSDNQADQDSDINNHSETEGGTDDYPKPAVDKKNDAKHGDYYVDQGEHS